jgi:hypothetical protein
LEGNRFTNMNLMNLRSIKTSLIPPRSCMIIIIHVYHGQLIYLVILDMAVVAIL